MAKEEADDSRTENATSREDDCFETRMVFKTSVDEGASMRKACMIEVDKVFEADVIEEVAMTNDIKSKVCQRETGETEGGFGKTKDQRKEVEDRGRKGIPTPTLETSAVVPVHQRETEETECVGGKAEDRKGDEEDQVNEHE